MDEGIQLNDVGLILANILSIVIFIFITWNYFSPLVAWYWPLVVFLIMGVCIFFTYYVLELAPDKN